LRRAYFFRFSKPNYRKKVNIFFFYAGTLGTMVQNWRNIPEWEELLYVRRAAKKSTCNSFRAIGTQLGHSLINRHGNGKKANPPIRIDFTYMNYCATFFVGKFQNNQGNKLELPVWHSPLYSRSTLLDSDVRVYFIIRWDPSAFIKNWKGSILCYGEFMESAILHNIRCFLFCCL